MSDSISIQFDGAGRLKELCNQYPERMHRIGIMSAYRVAARPVVRELKKREPRFKRMVGATAVKSRDKSLVMMRVGFNAKKGRGSTSGSNPPDWFKAYWKNYGTLSNRDASHDFVKARRRKTKTWSGGIKPRRTVEKVWSFTSPQVKEILARELENQSDKIIKKYAK